MSRPTVSLTSGGTKLAGSPVAAMTTVPQSGQVDGCFPQPAKNPAAETSSRAWSKPLVEPRTLVVTPPPQKTLCIEMGQLATKHYRLQMGAACGWRPSQSMITG